jgi:hypothetical protein
MWLTTGSTRTTPPAAYSKCGGSSEWTTRAHREVLASSSAKGRGSKQPRSSLLPLFTGVRGRVILRTSHNPGPTPMGVPDSSSRGIIKRVTGSQLKWQTPSHILQPIGYSIKFRKQEFSCYPVVEKDYPDLSSRGILDS